MSNSPAIGIDLGTTFCCVACFDEKHNVVEVIENSLGHKTTPSYVEFTDNEDVVGQLAKDEVLRKPENVVYDSKRLIGQKLSRTYLQQHNHNWSFRVSPGDNNTPLIHISQNGKTVTYTPQAVSAKLLSYMKSVVEERLEKKVIDAVITVPAYFSYHQRKATKEAAKLAGLRVLKFINEPTAAALAYIHKNKNKIEGLKHLLVFDLGGGTLDVSVVEVEENEQSITVLATCGNTELGGRDFDNNLNDLLLERINQEYHKNLEQDLEAKRRIHQECEGLKITLSFRKSTRAEFRSLFDNVNVNLEITREEFEGINMRLFESCLGVVEKCLGDANLEKSRIDTILLIGGSTRIPRLQAMLTQFFDGKELAKTINPEEAVAYGAAVHASHLKRNTSLRAHKVIDVTPLSLGTDLMGGIMEFVIPRNTQIPVTETRVYYTVTDQQDNADITIFEGERSLTRYNSNIGTCIMELPPKPPGYAVEVSFTIDASGMLDVGTMTEQGAYKGLTVHYGNQTEQMLIDIRRSFKENKEVDERMFRVITKWKFLKNYCTKMEALRTYDPRNMSDDDKASIERCCEYYSNWIRNNQIRDGSEAEERAIECMQNSLEVVCEPIAGRYGCSVKDMTWKEFYEFITE